MSDPFHPSRTFSEIARDLPTTIETAFADRAAHFFAERPALATGKTMRLASMSPEETTRQLPFLKQLPVARIEAVDDIPAEVETAADNVVRSRRGEDDPGATRGAAPKQLERSG